MIRHVNQLNKKRSAENQRIFEDVTQRAIEICVIRRPFDDRLRSTQGRLEEKAVQIQICKIEKQELINSQLSFDDDYELM